MKLSLLVSWLIALILILGVMIVISVHAHPAATQAPINTQLDANGVLIPPPQPPPTPSDEINAPDSHPFQHLVSYTNTGFAPSSLTITVGDTVRFTNNSTGELWVA